MAGPSPAAPQVGQRVQVDVSGMETSAGAVAAGTVVAGIITRQLDDGRFTIRLDAPVGGHALVAAPVARIRAVL